MKMWYVEKGPDSDVVLSSRVRLARNFSEYPFPHKTTPEMQQEIADKTKNALFAGSENMKDVFKYIDFSNLDIIEKAVLVEKHIVSKELGSRPIKGC